MSTISGGLFSDSTEITIWYHDHDPFWDWDPKSRRKMLEIVEMAERRANEKIVRRSVSPGPRGTSE